VKLYKKKPIGVKMKKILFICGSPPHPIHEKFARSIDADFFYFPNNSGLFSRLSSLFKIPRNYDIYFSEGLFGYLNLARKLGIISRVAKCVNLFSDPRLFQILNGEKFNFELNRVKKYPFLLKKIQINSIKNLDFAICIGAYQTDLLGKINSRIDIGVVPPMIERKIFFGKEVSSLVKNNIFFLGNGPDYNYKGLDFLVKIFGKIGKNFPKTKLYIVGAEWENFKAKIKNKNIIFVGKKNSKEIIKLMKDCSLCCHFGRGEAMGISILEAMSKGLPSVVSNQTGVKDYVSKVNNNFVKDFNEKQEIVKLIENYFNLPLKEKRKLGKRFRKVSIELTEKNSLSKFKKEFGKI